MCFIHTMHKGVMTVKKGSGWIERLAQQADLQGEAFPGQPLVEIYCDKRLLIENHRGVVGYSDNEICVRLKFGLLRICGSCLELAKMSHRQLVITGRIDSVHIMRGKMG